MGISAISIFLSIFFLDSLLGVYNFLFFLSASVVSHYYQKNSKNNELTIKKIDQEENLNPQIEGMKNFLYEFSLRYIQHKEELSSSMLQSQTYLFNQLNDELKLIREMLEQNGQKLSAQIQEDTIKLEKSIFNVKRDTSAIKENIEGVNEQTQKLSIELGKLSKQQKIAICGLVEDFENELKASRKEFRNEIAQLLEKKGNNISELEEIIKYMQEKRLNFSNSKHLENEQIKHKLYDAFKMARKNVYIQVPWLAKWILNDQGPLFNHMKEAIKRGVNIHINYGIDENWGYSGNSNRNRSDNSDRVADEMKRKLKKQRQTDGNLKMNRVNSHYKLFICDDKFYVEGSYNVLSNNGNRTHEAAQYSEDKERIKQLLNLYFKE
ncbi:MAG: phospholipase D-like domain-containing protein [Bacilli bacterium]